MHILLLGAGGREHALAWKMAQSPLCEKLFAAPGNAGTALHGENVDVDIKDPAAIGAFVLEKNVGMVVVGPEEPLVCGLGDYFAENEALARVLFVGPRVAGARLEGSKGFAKEFMQRHRIPTAGYRLFTCDTLEDGYAFVETLSPPYVLKADGLAAGKGVIICETRDEACAMLNEMLCGRKFGDASGKVLVEQYLKGREISVFVITDGRNYKLLPSAKDYKRVGEKDTGTNTGGMGAVSPVPFARDELMKRIEERIVQPTISGLQQDGIAYCGFLFFGLMIVDDDPYVIEYNVRLGDPEAEVIIPRIDSDLVSLMSAACRLRLHEEQVSVTSQSAVTVFLTSGGYPGTYDKGFRVSGIDRVKDSVLFFGGMRGEDGRYVTNGGRVIAVTALDPSLERALALCYKAAGLIDFKGKYYRRDIGKDLLKQSE